jgi:hypothetical protein
VLSAFEGNKAGTKTMLPVIRAFMTARQLPDVTVVADAGMISEASQKAIEAAGLSFILGVKIPGVPCQVDKWRREHPGEDIPDGHVFTRPWPAGPSSRRRDQWIYYQYRAGRARRALRGTDEQAAKAAKAVAGLAPVKRNRFTALDGAAKRVNRELEAKARDLRARPVCHRKRDSVEARLTAVFAALTVTRFTERRTGWPVKKFVRTARRYRTVQIRAGQHTLTAEDPRRPASATHSPSSSERGMP